MRKILFSLIALAALTFDAGAQWLRPAREVWSATNTWTFIPPTNNTSQAVHDWLDDYLVWADPIIRGSLLDGSSWTNLPDTNAVQSVFDWIDSHWPINIDIDKEYLPGTNIVGAVFTNNQWTLPASGVPVSTSSWSTLNPANTNAQAALDAIDDWMGYAESNLNVEATAGAASAAHNNGFTNTHHYAVPDNGNIVVTSFVPGAISANTNVIQWSASSPGRLVFKRDGGYLVYASLAATQGASRSFAYWYVYDAAGVYRQSFPIATVNPLTDGEYSEGAGVGVIVAASNNWYAEVGLNSSIYPTSSCYVGSIYVSAYKLYNRD